MAVVFLTGRQLLIALGPQQIDDQLTGDLPSLRDFLPADEWVDQLNSVLVAALGVASEAGYTGGAHGLATVDAVTVAKMVRLLHYTYQCRDDP